MSQNYLSSSKSRSISRVANSVQTTEGEGFVVNRAFPTNLLSDLDPFLLLDEIGPKDLAPREAKGAPDILIAVLKLLPIFLRVNSNIKTQEGIQGR